MALSTLTLIPPIFWFVSFDSLPLTGLVRHLTAVSSTNATEPLTFALQEQRQQDQALFQRQLLCQSRPRSQKNARAHSKVSATTTPQRKQEQLGSQQRSSARAQTSAGRLRYPTRLTAATALGPEQESPNTVRDVDASHCSIQDWGPEDWGEEAPTMAMLTAPDARKNFFRGVRGRETKIERRRGPIWRAIFGGM